MILQNFSNNSFLPSSASPGSSIAVSNPRSSETIAQVPCSTLNDVQSIVSNADVAYKSWSKLTISARSNYLLKFHQCVISNMSELSELIHKEHGKTLPEATAEIQKGLETLLYAASLSNLSQGKILQVSNGVLCRDERASLGVVVSVVPFNFPFMVPFWTIGHAICLGNTIILKPSEKCPLTLSRVAEIWKSVGLPDGVFNIVHGSKNTVEYLIDHPLVKCITFVGTSAVADAVYQRSRKLNKRCLALGGAKNHLVAALDCNVDMTASDVVNSFTGCSGQRCMAASVLLTIGYRQDLLDYIVRYAKDIIPDSKMGPVIDQSSLDRITKYIEEAEKLYDAKILLDGRSWIGKNSKGFWIGPTVILCKNASDPAMRDEIFGPVLSVYVCKDEQEAIDIENSCPYGNAACIYTESGKTSSWFLERFGAAMLGCNIGVPVPREPFSFGGAKLSKFGDFDITGDGAVEFFTTRRKITTKWMKPDQQTWLN